MLIILLLAATVISAFLGHGLEAVVIAIIVLSSVLLGFGQEYRAGRALEALHPMAAPAATVPRDGEETEAAARELVPADARLFECVNLQVEEAALTGESLPVEKHTAALTAAHQAAGDRLNLAYAGTTVTYGRGRAMVVATGMATEFGKIAKRLQTVETSRTPLQENLDRVGNLLARGAFVLVAVIVALGWCAAGRLPTGG